MGTYVIEIHIQTSVFISIKVMYLEYHYLVYCQTYLNHTFFSNTSETLQTLESMRTAPVIQYHLDLMKKCFHLKKSRVRKIDFLFLKRGMPPKNGNICTIPVHVYGIFIQFSLNPGHKNHTSSLIYCIFAGCSLNTSLLSSSQLSQSELSESLSEGDLAPSLSLP